MRQEMECSLLSAEREFFSSTQAPMGKLFSSRKVWVLLTANQKKRTTVYLKLDRLFTDMSQESVS